MLITIVGISVTLNAFLVYQFLGWRNRAYEAVNAADQHARMLDVTFYMLAKKAGVEDGEKEKLAHSIHELASIPQSSLRAKMADSLPIMDGAQAKKLGF
jgi:hypothetical protein